MSIITIFLYVLPYVPVGYIYDLITVFQERIITSYKVRQAKKKIKEERNRT